MNQTDPPSLADRIAELEKENTVIRALLARHECPYGHRNKYGICSLGYPGCACADDVFIFEDEHHKELIKKITQLSAALFRKDFVLRMCSIGSCSCGIKTNESKFHNSGCLYFQICEALSLTPEDCMKEWIEVVESISCCQIVLENKRQFYTTVHIEDGLKDKAKLLLASMKGTE